MPKEVQINPTKTDNIIKEGEKDFEYSAHYNSTLRDMEKKISEFIFHLQMENDIFKPDESFSELKEYVRTYERILYSTVSIKIFEIIEQDDFGRKQNSCRDRYGTVLSNLDALVRYSDSMNQNELSENVDKEKENEIILNTKKAVCKLWDHVNLAKKQYYTLRQSDDEFNRRFDEHIKEKQEEITKDMNSQLITMVGIFTALAFILFGGISSLQSIFEGLQESHLLKLLILACVWGLGILNVMFVFLFCITKMTKLNLKSDLSPKATFWQRYPVVCWTDFSLISMLVILSWLYYCANRNGNAWLDFIINMNPMLISIIGIIVIILLISLGFVLLYRKTKAKGRFDDENEAN